MNLTLPYSRNRRYLTGIDWVVGSLHEAGKKAVGIGAISQAVLDLQGRLDEQPLRAALDQISRRLPLIHGHFDRDWFNLAPYWKVPQSARSATIPLRVVDLPAGAEAEALRLLEKHVNTRFESDRQHVRLLLIRLGNDRTKLGLVFDHRLFDAFGAEALFRLIDETVQGRLEETAARIKTTEPAHLDHWPRRFLSGRALNRMFFRLKEQDICALALPAVSRGRRIGFVYDSMTVEQTQAINQKAFAETSVPILLPSAAARAVEAFRTVVPNPPLAGSQYLLFTSANLRPPGQEWETMFFNHLSFLLFTAPFVSPGSTAQAAIALRDQLFQHMKDQIPAAIEDASALGRIFPRPLVAKVINSTFKGRMCSFYFACLKETGYPGQTFMGLPALDLFHTPSAFVPPGMNLCMTYFANRFNLVLSYVDGAMEHSTAAGILSKFKELLV